MKKLLLLVAVMAASISGADAKKPNVLFIAIDDLNDWTDTLKGNPQAKTPHIDRLASNET